MLFFKLTIGFILDLIFGDPAWLYHPIRLIGRLISAMETVLRRLFPKTKQGELAGGAVLLIVVVGVSYAVSFFILKALAMIHPWIAVIVEVFWMYQIFAVKCLKDESMKVYRALKQHDLGLSRRMISYLVGRDTSELTGEEITKAAVETVAENTTDGVIAPMIFMAVGGAPLGFAYKAINTLDSMVGYKNEKYIYFGRVSAIADDVVNFIPARIAGILMIIASFLCGFDAKGAVKIFIRDRKKHLSPNSAQTESVCAGAFGIVLGGTHNYFGKPVAKPEIGDRRRRAMPEHILYSHILMYMTAILCMFLLNAIRFVIYVTL